MSDAGRKKSSSSSSSGKKKHVESSSLASSGVRGRSGARVAGRYSADGTLDLVGLSPSEISAHMFHPSSVRPLTASRIAPADVEAIRALLMDTRCSLLTPTAKSHLTDDQIRQMIFTSGGASPVYARLFLSYLSHLGVHFPSLHQLLDALGTLKVESQEYKIDLYLYFNKDLSPPADSPPQINQREIEVLFVEGGGFLTLTILQHLSSLASTFNSFAHLKQSLHDQVHTQLAKLETAKNHLVRFLTCANVQEFVLDIGTGEQQQQAQAPILNAASSSPMLEYKVTLDTIRHLLYIGATDVQLIYLLQRIYASRKGRKIVDERKLISLVKREWNAYLIDQSNALDWLKNPEKNLLFVESVVSVVSTGATAPPQSKVTTTLHVPHAQIDGAAVEKLYVQGGLGHATLAVLKSLNAAKTIKFRSIDALVQALKNQGEAIEAMAHIHAYLNGFGCALWPPSHAPRPEVTEAQISSLMASLPAGTTIPLVMRECRRYEKLGARFREKHNLARDGSVRKAAIPTAASAGHSTAGKKSPSPKSGGVVDDDVIEPAVGADIPHQFADWSQLASCLQNTMPAALAQLSLDRENLSLTLSTVNLFLARSFDAPDVLPGASAAAGASGTASGASTGASHSKLAFSNRDLDSLLAIVYAGDERTGAESSSSLARSPLTLLDLLSLLRKWHATKRKFVHFAALKRAVLQETGLAGTMANSSKTKSVTGGSSSASSSSSSSAAPSSTSVPSFDSLPSLGPNPSPLQEREHLRAFLCDPARTLMNGAGEPVHPWEDHELERLLQEKNALQPASAQAIVTSPTFVGGSAATPGVVSKGKDALMTGLPLFLSALRSLERHGPPSGYLNLGDLLQAVQEHYKALSTQMVDALKYLKTSRCLFADARLTITWTLAKEVLRLYTAAEADLMTLPLVRKLERERYQEEPFASLDDLISSLRQAKVEADRVELQQRRRPTDDAAGMGDASAAEADRSKVLAALRAASQPPGTQAASSTMTTTLAGKRRVLGESEHPPLMPLAFLEPAAAKEQISLLLAEYSLFQTLQHIAMLTHSLAVKFAESNLQAGLVSPSGAAVAQQVQEASSGGTVEVAVVPSKPAYATWHALHLALHESVLELNRLRKEILTLLADGDCPLLSLSPVPVVIHYDAVDRLVKACGLMHADVLQVLQHLSARGVRLRTLPELAARAKAFYLERRKAEQQSARYGYLKAEVAAYLCSDACPLFLTTAAKSLVPSALDDSATFVQLMQACGGSLKSCLGVMHALESEHLAFDSLDALIEGARQWAARELLKKQFLPFVNNANLCHLFERDPNAMPPPTPTGTRGKPTQTPAVWKDVRADDPALAQLLSIDISESALRELKKHSKPKSSSSSLATDTSPSLNPLSAPPPAEEEDTPTQRVEMVLDFVYRMNAGSTRRFRTFAELVAVVAKELERPKDANNPANPLVPATPMVRGGRSSGRMDFGLGSRGDGSARGGMDQHQHGYDSDEEVDPRELNRSYTNFVPPSPSNAPAGGLGSPNGPTGLQRKASLSARGAGGVLSGTPTMKGFHFPLASSQADGGDSSGSDLSDTEEQKVAEEARRKSRANDKLRREVEQLQHHGWLLKEDEEWLAIDRRTDLEEPEMTEELLNERRLAIFSALSYPTCLLFSNRVEPMSLSDIDLDAVLSSAGGGEKGLRIAIAIIRMLDRKHAKYHWFDQVTLEIARRWQRRKAWEYLTLDPVGKKLLEHSSSVPLFVLRLLVAINKAHGVDPALSVVDMLQLAHEVHPEPFQTHAELIHLLKELVRTERRETLKAAITSQFVDMFPHLPVLTDTKMDLLLAGVDDSLYHALKYLELVQAEGGRSFVDILDLVPILTSLHSREKSAMPDAFSGELEREDEEAEKESRGRGTAPDDTDSDADDDDDDLGAGEDAVMLRRQKIFMHLSFPRCTLFVAKQEPFTLTDVDLDDVLKACQGRLSYALKAIARMDKVEKLKFHTFHAFVLDLAKRCQVGQIVQFIHSHDNHLLHHSIVLPGGAGPIASSSIALKRHPDVLRLVDGLIASGMGRVDPYLPIVACLKALNQVPKVLAQSPPAGGYRSIGELEQSLKSLADEQKVWMVKSFFSQTSIRITFPEEATPPADDASKAPKAASVVKKGPAVSISDYQVATLLHSCANSIYFVLRHLQSLEIVASMANPPTVYVGYEPLLAGVAAAHLRVLSADSSLRQWFTPSTQPIGAIRKPNEAKQMALQEQRLAALAAGTAIDRASRDQILIGVDPNAEKVRQAALAVIEYEKQLVQAQATDGPKPPPTVLSPALRFLTDARFQLLSALSFPKSHLFSRCLRPVAIGEAELDAVLRATYSTAAEEDVDHESLDQRDRETKTTPAVGSASFDDDPASSSLWTPTVKQLNESIRIVRLFDAGGLRFRSFPHFLKEYRAFMRAEQRKILVGRLFYPTCKVFTSCTRAIEIADADLDRLLCLPKRRRAHAIDAGGDFIQLAHVLAAIEHLDGQDVKVYSFGELVDLVTQLLAHA